jgi:hypothetical protein
MVKVAMTEELDDNQPRYQVSQSVAGCGKEREKNR